MKVLPGRICGEINIIPSKSHTHRLLICAALSKTSTTIRCPLASDDILHTKNCLNVLCADIEETGNGFLVDPRFPDDAPVLPCGESGSTYRFLLPVAAALGINARFILKGRLPDRPMDALFETLEAHGVSVNGRNTGEVHIAGKLRGGEFHLPGDISSQFVSGLLLAAPLTGEDCAIVLTSPLQSKGYVDMTLEAVRAFGIRAETSRDRIFIPGGQNYVSPGHVTAQGDWSNAAVWLCAAAAGGDRVSVTGLSLSSPQGDKAIIDVLRAFHAQVVAEEGKVTVDLSALVAADIDISDTPDLAPAIALLCLKARGTSVMKGAGRLRLKESDRTQSITDTLRTLGGDAFIDSDRLVIRGKGALAGGTCNAFNDHRIVMMAACSAVLAQNPIEIAGSEAVNKSYPNFFDDLRILGIRTE